MRYILLTLALLFSVAQAESVYSVHDGDTFRLNRPQTECLQAGHHPKQQQRVRIWGIDAPEISQPYGTQSRDYLKSLVLGKDVRLECTGCSFDRKVCKVYQGGKSIDSEMIRSGWAFDSVKFTHGAYAKEENQAKAQHAGVWKSPNGGERPWDYRHKH